MPRRLYNWSYRNVVDFPKENGYVFSKELAGSHERWVKHHGDGRADTLVEVNFTRRSYSVKTLKRMIRQSGIAEREWIDWGGA